MHTEFTDAEALSKKLCEHQITTFLKYATEDNIANRVLSGYHQTATDICLLTKATAIQLCKVQNSLNNQGYGLYIFDAYRPQKAVEDLYQWSLEDEDKGSSQSHLFKTTYYPNYSRQELFELEYISKNSNHCYGHTVDCTLLSIESGNIVEMGSNFDMMDQSSHIDHQDLPKQILRNRQILQQTMIEHGFEPYAKEWWHFAFPPGKLEKPENFDIVASLKGLGVETK